MQTEWEAMSHFFVRRTQGTETHVCVADSAKEFWASALSDSTALHYVSDDAGVLEWMRGWANGSHGPETRPCLDAAPVLKKLVTHYGTSPAMTFALLTPQMRTVIGRLRDVAMKTIGVLIRGEMDGSFLWLQ